jgi:hypothetical protein
MTERQHNSKLLSDKLSSLPVPPNEALWSRIEAQLLAVPVVQQPPAKPLIKATGLKITIAVVITVLLAIFVIWKANRKAPQRSPTPTTRKTTQQPTLHNTKADTAIVQPVKPIQENKPLVKPTPQPAPIDTQVFTPLTLPNRREVDLPLRDSVPAISPFSEADLRVDSVKLPPKKDEEYYFERKKKKG